jgi:hypothetical protein
MSESEAMNAATTIPTAVREQRPFFKRVFDQWRRAAHAIGVVQTRFLMLSIYAFAVVPTGLLMKLVRDPLQLRPPEKTNCQPHRNEEQNLETARRQF